MVKEKVLVTGGAGYVGSVLVPKLLESGFDVRVLDLMIFGSSSLDKVRDRCEIIRGDVRDSNLVEKCLEGVNSVIHLAAIANDPCSDLNPDLTLMVNYESTKKIAEAAKKLGAGRFIFASSSSVYGIREEEDVTENLELRPLTIYSKTKAMAEEAIKRYNDENFTTVSIRSATICGYSPRTRLDVVVNIFTSDAVLKREIVVNGGEQKRPNVHIEDVTDLYTKILYVQPGLISGEVFNYGRENHSLNYLAEMVRGVVGEDVKISKNMKNADSRSYHISSEKIEKNLGICPRWTIRDAVIGLKKAFEEGLIPCPEDSRYRNVARMKEINLK